MSKLEQSSRCIVITHLMLIMGMESQGHTCIRFCEIDKFARASYQAIFETEGELEYHDITRITDDQLRQLRGQVDILCGDFPLSSHLFRRKTIGI